MEFKKIHIIGIIAAVVTIGISFLFMGNELFFFLIGIGVIIGISPFTITMIYTAKVNGEKEEMFLEFARNLVESVKTGTPISKSIVNMRNKPYGLLSENIKKMANQISMGIPLNQALRIFADDVNNKPIARVITMIGQAERSGGDIGEILESVAGAVSLSDKLKKERKSAISSLVVQGYIIFFVFMVIILVMQFKILPMLTGIGNVQNMGYIGIGNVNTSDAQNQISNSFLYLLLIQGFFSGVIIGKLAEGSVKAGIKHSFALMIISFLVFTGANLLFGA